MPSRVADPWRGLGGPPATPGTVHLVGGGPGDPSALTLRAAQVLATCDVVAHDHLSPPEALALVPAQADRILVGRRSGRPGHSREELDELLVARAAAGQAVVRLKGGDPYVFGRGGEEVLACHAGGVPYEVIPGVTSAVAVPGAAGIPVTHRAVATGFAVVTAHAVDGAGPSGSDVEALARFPGTLVILMGLSRVRELCQGLTDRGRDPDTPAAVIAHGTWATQVSVRATLATLPDEVDRRGLPAPAITVIGDVAAVLDEQASREQRPLHGLRVLLPGTEDDADVLAGHLRHAGAAVLRLDIGAVLPGDGAAARRLAVALRDGEVRTLTVAEADGAAVLLEALVQVGGDVRSLAGVELRAVGEDVATRLRDDHHVVAETVVTEPVPPAVAVPEAVVHGAGGPPRLAGSVPPAWMVATSRHVAATATAIPDVDVVVAAGPVAARWVGEVSSGAVPVVAYGAATGAEVSVAGLEVAATSRERTPAALVEALRALMPERSTRALERAGDAPGRDG